MAIFTRKEKTVQERLTAVNERLGTLEKQVISKEKSIADAHAVLSDALGTLALEPNENNEAAAKRGRVALSRQQESLEDLKIMVKALQTERAKLQKEGLQALIREAPAKAAEHAEAYNMVLAESAKLLQVLRSFRMELLMQQGAYKEVLKQRADALRELGITEGLTMQVGLGELALAPTPYRHIQETPDGTLDKFLGALIYYEAKLKDYQAQPHEDTGWAVGDKEGFGAVGSPDPGYRGFVIPFNEPGAPADR